jgi:hypothetical protein
LIVTPESAEERVKVMKYFIHLCSALLEIRNFDTVFCVVGGLMSASVYRLKQTKELLSEEDVKKLADFREIVSLQGGFGIARAHLESCGDYPTLPYYGMYLGDLKSVHDFPMRAHFTKVAIEIKEQGIKFVNFLYTQREYELISELQRWKLEHSYYPMEGHTPDMLKISHIQNLISEGMKSALPVQDLFELSLVREPR